MGSEVPPYRGSKDTQFERPPLFNGIRSWVKSGFDTISGRRAKDAKVRMNEARADFEKYQQEFNSGGSESANDPEKVLILTEKAFLAKATRAKLFCDYCISLFVKRNITQGPMYERLLTIAMQLGIEHSFQEIKDRSKN